MQASNQIEWKYETVVENYERPPRKWHAKASLFWEIGTSMHIFTDGSLEGETDSEFSAGLGSVLVDQFGKCIKSLLF